MIRRKIITNFKLLVTRVSDYVSFKIYYFYTLWKRLTNYKARDNIKCDNFISVQKGTKENIKNKTQSKLKRPDVAFV